MKSPSHWRPGLSLGMTRLFRPNAQRASNRKPRPHWKRPGLSFPHKECHPWLLAVVIQAESFPSVKQKPLPEGTGAKFHVIFTRLFRLDAGRESIVAPGAVMRNERGGKVLGYCDQDFTSPSESLWRTGPGGNLPKHLPGSPYEKPRLSQQKGGRSRPSWSVLCLAARYTPIARYGMRRLERPTGEPFTQGRRTKHYRVDYNGLSAGAARTRESQRQPEDCSHEEPRPKGTESKSVLISAMMPMQGRPIQTECSAGVKRARLAVSCPPDANNGRPIDGPIEFQIGGFAIKSPIAIPRKATPDRSRQFGTP
jgi:hypothetical protein